MRISRDLAVLAQVGPQMVLRREHPCVVLFPNYDKDGAALLRIYNVADGLAGRGWRVCVFPPKLTLRQRQRWLSYVQPDVIVMQGSRHALNRPSYYPGFKIVYDIDDADFHLPHLTAAVQEAMPQVRTVMAGSEYIANWCRGAGAQDVRVVWTGAPVSKMRQPQTGRPAVVAWAQTKPTTYKQEAELVARTMAGVAARQPGVTLRLFDRQEGDDPRFIDMFRAPGLDVEWLPKMSYSDFLKALDDVAVGLAPLCPETEFSRGKSFGKVLAYMDRMVPVVASDEGEPAQVFTPQTGGLCKDERDWVDTTVRFLQSEAAREAAVAAAYEVFQQHLTTEAAADRVAGLLDSIIRDAARGQAQLSG